MRILHITDTHGFHEGLDQDWSNIDMVIHTGDASNSRNTSLNALELDAFLQWYNWIPVKHKIYVAGNHDTALEKWGKDYFDWGDVIYLQDEEVVIEGIKLYGTPWCNQYGNWSFMKEHNKLDTIFKEIPEDTDILCTHQPPKGILDLAPIGNNVLEYCGNKSLLNRVKEVAPDYHLFGHIHNNGPCQNYGVYQKEKGSTTFINSTGVVDRKFRMGLLHHGHIFETR